VWMYQGAGFPGVQGVACVGICVVQSPRGQGFGFVVGFAGMGTITLEETGAPGCPGGQGVLRCRGRQLWGFVLFKLTGGQGFGCVGSVHEMLRSCCVAVQCAARIMELSVASVG
jgi:hypothetical protein